MLKGIITNVQGFAIHDGPGIRTTVFLKGCPLRCLWCDNPETREFFPQIFFYPMRCKECGKCVQACPEGLVSTDKTHKINREKCTLCMLCVNACKYGGLEKIGYEITSEELVREIEKDSPFYRTSVGGVTFSGGEPLFQADFTSEVAKLCKEKHISVVLDTSGYAELNELKKVLRYVDQVLLDIKHMDSDMHKKYTAVPNEPILRNAEWMAGKVDTRISFPLLPNINDSDENVRKTAEFVASLGLEWIDLLPFHKLGDQKYRFLGLESPYVKLRKISKERVNVIRKLIESYGLKTTIGREIL